MESIKSIKAFSSAHEMFEYVYGEEYQSNLSADEKDFLRDLNDYENFGYFLLNDDIVMVTDFLGDVSGTPMPIEDFLRETISYVKENA